MINPPIVILAGNVKQHSIALSKATTAIGGQSHSADMVVQTVIVTVVQEIYQLIVLTRMVVKIILLKELHQFRENPTQINAEFITS